MSRRICHDDKLRQEMRRRPKVLLIGHDMNTHVGGIVTYMSQLLESKLADRYLLEWEHLELAGSSPRRVISNDLPRIQRTVRQGQYDILHANITLTRLSYFKLVFYLYLRARFGFRIFLQIHGGSITRAGIASRLYANLIARCDVTAFLSQRQLDEVLHFAPERGSRFILLPNFVYGPETVPSRESTIRTFLFLARAEKEKGLLDLVHAAGKLSSDDQAKAHFIICGDGGALREAKEIASRLKLGCFEFRGFVRDDRKLRALAEADVTVLPSYSEAFPLTILEGMSFGHAIVATPVGAIPTVVADGHDGYLVEPGDVDALADRLARLIRKPEVVRLFGTRNRRRFEEKYDMHGPGWRTYDMLYRQLADQSSVAARDNVNTGKPSSLQFGESDGQA